MKLESLKEFQANSLNQAEMKCVLGGKKIVRKFYGSMRGSDGKVRQGVYLSSYDTETCLYTYYNLLGQEVYCP